MTLDAFEVIERLQTRYAAVVCLARSGAEFTHALSVGARTARTPNLRRTKQVAWTRDCVRWRRDAECFQLTATALGQPIAGPRRGQNLFDDGAFIPSLIESLANRATDDFR